MASNARTHGIANSERVPSVDERMTASAFERGFPVESAHESWLAVGSPSLHSTQRDATSLDILLGEEWLCDQQGNVPRLMLRSAHRTMGGSADYGDLWPGERVQSNIAGITCPS